MVVAQSQADKKACGSAVGQVEVYRGKKACGCAVASGDGKACGSAVVSRCRLVMAQFQAQVKACERSCK